MAEKKLKVVLLSSTPNAEKLVALAAKLCYSPANIEDLLKKITEKDQKDFVEKLIEMTHMSPVEHVVFTFGIEGISRACTHQLVRHRLASYSQQSQRYVKEENLDYILPPLIKDCKFAVHYNGDQWFEDKMKEIQKWYKELIDKGILPEDARFLLPNAAETKIIITMNARELLHFFKERCCLRAQWEIRAMAEEMLRLAMEKCPIIFSKAGPACVNGLCNQGKMTCGKIIEVREKFDEIKEEIKQKQ